MFSIYERLAGFLPNGLIEGLHRQLNYNGIKISERKFAGFILIYSLALGFAVSFAGLTFFGFEPLISFPIVAALVVFLTYISLKMNSEAKGKFVESVLPDALQIIASNMKSGLTTERALFVAGRPEFGPLQIELKNASKRISSGERVEVALLGISDKINSVALNKTLWLISQGIRSGGQISDLLMQLADDLKGQQSIQDEIKSNISIYVLLILFASMAGAPLLFGISSFIVQVLTKQISSTPKIDIADVPSGNLDTIRSFATGTRDLPSNDFIMTFSIVTLIATSLFAAVTIGAINTGKEINGIKYVLPIIFAALLIFFGVRTFLLAILGSLV